jgi:AcrR family transcriptional regulator
MAERRSGTRDKIRAVALELFSSRGYEKTSLREIAEKLGVTKAAIYHHFKTKEEIIGSLIDDFLLEVDGLIAWAKEQDPTLQTRHEIIRRYSRIVWKQWLQVVRFFQENQPAMRDLQSGPKLQARFKELGQLLVEPDATLEEKVRARVSFFAVHIGVVLTADLAQPEEERCAALLNIALGLIQNR